MPDKLIQTIMDKGHTRSDAQMIADMALHIAQKVGEKMDEMARVQPKHLQAPTLMVATAFIWETCNQLLKDTAK